MAEDDADDFNRLYERLVVRRSSKQKRGKLVAASPKTPPRAASTGGEDAAALKETFEAARCEELRQLKQQERDVCVSRAVKRLRLARSLRGFARLSRCSPQRLALQLASSSEHEDQRFLRKYQKVKRQRSGLLQRRGGRTEALKRYMRLERVAARLYLRRASDFGCEAATTLEGRLRVIDELLFFSPPSSKFQSKIGYADLGNAVPPPPLRSTSFK